MATREEAQAAKVAADGAAATAAAGAASATGDFAAELARLRAELEAARGALSKTPAPASPVPEAPAAPPGAKPVETKPPKDKKPVDQPVRFLEAGSASAKLLAKKAGIGKSELRAPVAAGALDLTKLALGVRGMALLGGLEQRAAQNFRGLFAKIDPMPVVRGADRFLQVFNKSSATGKAMEGVFQRSFTSLFSLIEKLAPYAQTAFQGMILGALYLEEGWLRARIALFPLTEAVTNFIGPTNGMRIAAVAGGTAVAGMGYAALGALGPIVAMTAAVGAALGQIQALNREWDSSSLGQIKKKLALDTGAISQKDRDKQDDAERRGDFEAAQARFAKERAAKAAAGGPPGTKTAEPTGAPAATAAAGKVDGKAFADGVVAGMKEGVPAVTAAGVVVAQAADTGVRVGGKIKSPSKLTQKSGREFPAGTAKGIRDGRGEVQAAADDAMVPTTGGRGAGPAASGAPSKIELTIINQWPAGVAQAARADLEMVVDVAIHKALRAINLALGVPVARGT